MKKCLTSLEKYVQVMFEIKIYIINEDTFKKCPEKCCCPINAKVHVISATLHKKIFENKKKVFYPKLLVQL